MQPRVPIERGCRSFLPTSPTAPAWPTRSPGYPNQPRSQPEAPILNGITASDVGTPVPLTASARLLVTGLGDRAVVAVQNPVRLSDISEPQPDLAVLRPRTDRYSESHPGPGDVLLIIEVVLPA